MAFHDTKKIMAIILYSLCFFPDTVYRPLEYTGKTFELLHENKHINYF